MCQEETGRDRGRSRVTKWEAVAIVLVRDGDGLVKVMRSGWIQFRDIDIFCFMFRQFNSQERA